MVFVSERALGFAVGVKFHVTESLLERLRDEAVDAALEAEVRKKKWQDACLVVARRKLGEKFGGWEGRDGVMTFPNGDHSFEKRVRLGDIEFVSNWCDNSVRVCYHQRLGSGKLSKVSAWVSVEHVLLNFKPDPKER